MNADGVRAPPPPDPAGQRQRFQPAQNLRRRSRRRSCPRTPDSSADQFTLLPASIISDRYFSLRPATRPRRAGRRVRRGRRTPAPRRRGFPAPCAAPADAAEVVTTSTSSVARCAPSSNPSGRRSCESSTMRSSGRLRGRPVRSVSRQSSASTVPMPVRIASRSWRSCCTCARARLAGDPARDCRPARRSCRPA